MSVGLTANEVLLFDRIYSDLPGDLPPASPISARVLRQAMLEIDPVVAGAGRRRASRWEIHNAVFDIELDLRDACRSDGSSLPALEFIDCEFQSGFCADGAQMERLAFLRCSFTASEPACLQPAAATPSKPDNAVTVERRPVRNHINLRNARIATELTFEGLHACAAGSDAGILTVDAFAAAIGTNLLVSDCTFRAPQGESSATLPEPRYALHLATAHIGCDVKLTPLVRLDGGLKARDARIGGTLWALGLHATDGESDESRQLLLAQRRFPRHAIHLETVHIEGNLVLGPEANELERTGILLREAHSAGKLAVPSGKILPMRDTVLASANFHCGGTLTLLNSSIGGSLVFSPGIVERDLVLTNAVVKGTVMVETPQLTGILPLSLRKSIAAGPLLVSGSAFLSNVRFSSSCDLALESPWVYIDGATFGDRLTLSGTVNTLTAPGLTVAGDLAVGVSGLVECNLNGATVGGALDLDAIKLISFQPQPIGVAQSAELSFYPGWRVTEFLLATEPGRTPRMGIIAYLTCIAPAPKRGVWQPVLLSGLSAPIRHFNRGQRSVILPSGKPGEISGPTPLVLETEDQARDYLRFFCAFVWGDAGSFGLITEAKDLPAAFTPDASILSLPCERSANPQEGRWDIHAYTRYGDVLYLCTYRVAATGAVKMPEDTEAARYEWSDAGKLSSFSSPYRYPAAYTLSGVSGLKEYRSDFQGWLTLDTDAGHIAEASKAVPGWQDAITRLPGVWLRHASCKVLNDDRASIWSDASGRIYLNGFDYHSVDVTSENLDRRLAWVRQSNPVPENLWASFGWILFTLAVLSCVLLGSLAFALHGRDAGALADAFTRRFAIAVVVLTAAALLLTYVFYKRRVQKTSGEGFNAQPYAQLASVLRNRGDDDLAKQVEAEKMWQEAQKSKTGSFWGMLSMIVWQRPYRVLFGYGLRPWRALVSLVAFWILGWAAVSLLSGNQMLQANVTTLAPAALIQNKTPVLIVPAGTDGTQAVSIPCGDAIEPGLYSFELLTPILNLHQESRCNIQTKPNGSLMTFLGRSWKVPSIFTHASLWEYGKALYMLFGSILSSLALLTFSGIARRWEN